MYARSDEVGYAYEPRSTRMTTPEAHGVRLQLNYTGTPRRHSAGEVHAGCAESMVPYTYNVGPQQSEHRPGDEAAQPGSAVSLDYPTQDAGIHNQKVPGHVYGDNVLVAGDHRHAKHHRPAFT